jgi:hypothetical protein
VGQGGRLSKVRFLGKKYEMSGSHKNRMLALFRLITRPDMCTRRCGLVWRLYLQFVHAHFDPALCRNVYYCAVEECPWLKVSSTVFITRSFFINFILGVVYRRCYLYSCGIGTNSGSSDRKTTSSSRNPRGIGCVT